MTKHLGRVLFFLRVLIGSAGAEAPHTWCEVGRGGGDVVLGSCCAHLGGRGHPSCSHSRQTQGEVVLEAAVSWRML